MPFKADRVANKQTKKILLIIRPCPKRQANRVVKKATALKDSLNGVAKETMS